MIETDNIWRFEIRANAKLLSGSSVGYGFATSSGSISEVPESDFFLDIPLFRTVAIHEYSDIQKPNEIQLIDRQEINPYYLEYDFFTHIKRNKINNGNDLNIAGINFIRSNMPQLSGLTNQEVTTWFDYIGFNSLPWSLSNGVSQITIDDLEDSQNSPESIISKANILNIDVYK